MCRDRAEHEEEPGADGHAGAYGDPAADAEPHAEPDTDTEAAQTHPVAGCALGHAHRAAERRRRPPRTAADPDPGSDPDARPTARPAAGHRLSWVSRGLAH